MIRSAAASRFSALDVYLSTATRARWNARYGSGLPSPAVTLLTTTPWAGQTLGRACVWEWSSHGRRRATALTRGGDP
jgi:hypothetical protein